MPAGRPPAVPFVLPARAAQLNFPPLPTLPRGARKPKGAPRRCPAAVGSKGRSRAARPKMEAAIDPRLPAGSVPEGSGV